MQTCSDKAQLFEQSMNKALTLLHKSSNDFFDQSLFLYNVKSNELKNNLENNNTKLFTCFISNLYSIICSNSTTMYILIADY